MWIDCEISRSDYEPTPFCVAGRWSKPNFAPWDRSSFAVNRWSSDLQYPERGVWCCWGTPMAPCWQFLCFFCFLMISWLTWFLVIILAYVFIHTYIYTYLYIHTYIYIYTYIHTYIYIYIYIYIYTYIYTHIYTHIYTYIYTYIYIHIYIHIYQTCQTEDLRTRHRDFWLPEKMLGWWPFKRDKKKLVASTNRAPPGWRIFQYSTLISEAKNRLPIKPHFINMLKHVETIRVSSRETLW